MSVAPERLSRWIEGFAVRHGAVEAAVTDEVVRLAAADGSVAECHVPFPPLRGDRAEDLVEHACRERTVGVLLVRLGGYAAGVFTGDRLVAAKVGSRPVHGRSAAGGWSQQRFARRREKQSAEALGAAADVAFRVLVPYAAGLDVAGPGRVELDAVVLGGDRRAVAELRGDRRLAPLFALEAEPFLTVPDPRRNVLEGTPAMFRSVRIRVVETGEAGEITD
ncbi:acVLRF1 family peptidyl-tRNA hydrolase [Sphaerimonospora thailandensis]|uniref:Actinobacteria/chloroflexi VLRF1 release factor domain-containing protein n=1 Tax=Sphaerimonospora thailandensis TaxID=795644 RepID=A0A8J3R957_9ACTN|nr:acVLRF1 family peptidyl-tRNA hydrolase [Sphaerimonospora thailandensis]GIH70056.1 hypothetical protein Mth01_23090 [Sphaerimonospora thailandensis]